MTCATLTDPLTGLSLPTHVIEKVRKQRLFFSVSRLSPVKVKYPPVNVPAANLISVSCNSLISTLATHLVVSVSVRPLAHPLSHSSPHLSHHLTALAPLGVVRLLTLPCRRTSPRARLLSRATPLSAQYLLSPALLPVCSRCRCWRRRWPGRCWTSRGSGHTPRFPGRGWATSSGASAETRGSMRAVAAAELRAPPGRAGLWPPICRRGKGQPSPPATGHCHVSCLLTDPTCYSYYSPPAPCLSRPDLLPPILNTPRRPPGCLPRLAPLSHGLLSPTPGIVPALILLASAGWLDRWLDKDSIFRLRQAWPQECLTP